MDPVITGLIASNVLTAIAGYYVAEKARKGNKKQLNQLSALFDKIKPPDYDFTIEDPPEFHAKELAKPKYQDPLKAPRFDFNKITPEEIKLVGDFSPKLAAQVKEIAPTTISQTGDMKSGRAAQMAALRKMQDVAQGEFDPEYAELVNKASRAAQGDAQSRQASIMQDFARRGIGGSTMNLAAQLGSASQAADTQAMANQAAATQAYKNRLNAYMSGADLGSQIGREDVDMQTRNADIINSFNQRMARSGQDYQNQQADTLNSASKFNLGQRQRLEEMNVNARNEAAVADRNRLDALTKYGVDFAGQERDRLDRLAQQQYSNADAERKYLNTLLATKASWEAGEREKMNRLRSEQFQDQLDIGRAQSGITSNRMAQNTGAAQDRIAAIQGLSNAANTGLMYYGDQQDRAARARAEQDLDYYRKYGQKPPDPEERDSYYKAYG